MTPPTDPRAFSRADIHVEGLNQAGPSFELRLFINNATADERTPTTRDSGYAGSIFVYGGGGHDETPIALDRSIDATDAVVRALERGEPIHVTAVATRGDLPMPRAIDIDVGSISLQFDPIYE